MFKTFKKARQPFFTLAYSFSYLDNNTDLKLNSRLRNIHNLNKLYRKAEKQFFQEYVEIRCRSQS